MKGCVAALDHQAVLNGTMTETTPLPQFLAEPSRIGTEISITGKWVPTEPGGRFRTSPEAREMLAEWEDIHAGARADDEAILRIEPYRR